MSTAPADTSELKVQKVAHGLKETLAQNIPTCWNLTLARIKHRKKPLRGTIAETILALLTRTEYDNRVKEKLLYLY